MGARTTGAAVTEENVSEKDELNENDVRDSKDVEEESISYLEMDNQNNSLMKDESIEESDTVSCKSN